MSKGLVLVTGLNGYIAAVAAKQLLDSSYSVRGTVRKLSSADALIQGPLKAYYDAGTLTLAEVPDITVDGAFDEAVKGVTAIAHLASPVSFFFTNPDPIIRTAVHGTLTLLTSALHAGPQLKTVLTLSSIAAILNNRPAPVTYTEADWNDVAEADVASQGSSTPGPLIYAASKTAAEKAFWAFKQQHKPAFTMTALNPVFVIGPPLLAPNSADQVGETIRSIYTIFSGGEYPPSPGLPQTIDVRDVAKLLTYLVENPNEADGERYIASSAVRTSQAVADILRNAYPEAKSRIVEGAPGQGYRSDYQADMETVPVVDSGKARRLIGEWIPFEKSVVDTARMFESLVEVSRL